MRDWFDPRASRTPLAGLFGLGLVFVADLSRPAGVLDSGLWIPVLYAAVPVALGVLAYVRTRTAAGRPLSPAVLVALTAWGLVGATLALVIVVVLGLGRPARPGPPSALFGFLTGLLTYLVPTGAFGGLYGAAGRRPRREAALLALAAPVVTAAVLAALVLLLR